MLLSMEYIRGLRRKVLKKRIQGKKKKKKKGGCSKLMSVYIISVQR
jgi:hypothetical protein